MKDNERKVDECLPPWLNSKILSAVDFVWKVRVDDNMGEQSKRRIKSLSKQLDADEMCWVLMLLTLPRINDILNDILLDSDVGREFKERKRAERTLH